MSESHRLFCSTVIACLACRLAMDDGGPQLLAVRVLHNCCQDCYMILNPVDKSIKNCRVGIAHLDSVGNAHPTIAQLVFQDLFQPHSV
jgi:hypothetical protein